MKKHTFLYYLFVFSTIVMLNSCGDDDEETCDEVPVCTNESATSCCTCNSDECCSFTYDGTEYDTADEVADACGGSGSVRVQIINDLNASRARAKANL